MLTNNSKMKEEIKQKQVYHQPKLFVIGSLEQIQAGQGNKCDGADCLSYYYG